MGNIRLPEWLTAAVSVALLLAVGLVGWQMNQSAVHTAEAVHRADVTALAVNNTVLTDEFLNVSARELSAFVRDQNAALATVDPGDRALLDEFTKRSVFFGHGAALADPNGRIIASVSDPLGLPAADHPGYAPLRAPLDGRTFVFSDVLSVNGTSMLAVATPILGPKGQSGMMIGYNLLRTSWLQRNMVRARHVRRARRGRRLRPTGGGQRPGAVGHRGGARGP